ncbi:MAG TPA: polyprenol monophosphomannose synthase [Planctomycetota bacterium]|nr:polyprenol monophosphomannose synthase [Planctomycetota bacterium]HRR79003.1 polyprenol monophosphomannose synthase [Planctomycetota bacterium]HRT93451.1 polyprenol monophosphomannose synthase [Planctomycetota bacterium]
MPRTLIVLATYNERENLPALVQALLALGLPDLDILVVDDNSPDGTGQLADELAATHGNIRVLHRAGKLGLGTAHVAAMRHAIEHGYDFVVTMDADFSHHPRYLPDILARRDDADLILGSRYVPGGGVRNWGRLRRLMSWGANAYVRLLLGLRPRDCSGAYKCYRVATLRRVDLDHIVAKGYAFQEEITWRMQLAGARIVEVPIVFENRRLGQTKMSWREIAGLFTTVLRLRWRKLRGRLHHSKGCDWAKSG